MCPFIYSTGDCSFRCPAAIRPNRVSFAALRAGLLRCSGPPARKVGSGRQPAPPATQKAAAPWPQSAKGMHLPEALAESSREPSTCRPTPAQTAAGNRSKCRSCVTSRGQSPQNLIRFYVPFMAGVLSAQQGRATNHPHAFFFESGLHLSRRAVQVDRSTPIPHHECRQSQTPGV